MADIVLSPRQVGLNAPLKIFDYLAAAKPIVATDIQAHRAILNEHLAEFTSTDAAGLAEGIKRVLKNPDRAATLSSAASNFAEKALSWDAFVSFIDSLARSNPGTDTNAQG